MSRRWSRKIRKLLINWSKQITINETEHIFRGNRYKFINKGLNFFDIVGKTGILTTLISAIANQNVTLVLIVWLTVIDALILTTDSISIFFDFGGLSEKHFSASKEYNSLSKLIDSTLALEPEDRDNPKEFLTLVMKKFSNISGNAPNLPYNAKVHKLDLQIYENPEDARGDKDSTSSEEPPSIEMVRVTPEPETPRNRVRFESGMMTPRTERAPRTENSRYLNYQWNRLAENEV